jgi:hypothetical protein
MLLWHDAIYLIDHNASLYFHHAWTDYLARSRSSFPQIKEHVLLPFAGQLTEADATLSRRLTPEIIQAVVGLVPDSWLDGEPRFASPDENRAAYIEYLLRRLEPPRDFMEEARNARALSL